MPVWVPKIETRRPLRESPGRTSTRGSPRGRRLIQVLAVGRTSAKAAEVKRHVNDADLLRRGAAVSQRAPSPRPSRHSSTGVAWARGPSGAPGGAGGRPLARSSSGRRDPRRPPQRVAEPHARRARIPRSARRRGVRAARRLRAESRAAFRRARNFPASPRPSRPTRTDPARSRAEIRAVRPLGARGVGSAGGGGRSTSVRRQARDGFRLRRRFSPAKSRPGHLAAIRPFRSRRRLPAPRPGERRNPRCPARQVAEPREGCSRIPRCATR